MKKNNRIIDEHEEMVALQQSGNWKNNIVMVALIILAVVFIALITVGIIKKEREKQKIDAIVSSIQNEIYVKQCNLDKMYCCGYKDKSACEKWAEASCSEPDGSLEINCKDLKL